MSLYNIIYSLNHSRATLPSTKLATTQMDAEQVLEADLSSEEYRA